MTIACTGSSYFASGRFFQVMRVAIDPIRPRIDNSAARSTLRKRNKHHFEGKGTFRNVEIVKITKLFGFTMSFFRYRTGLRGSDRRWIEFGSSLKPLLSKLSELLTCEFSMSNRLFHFSSLDWRYDVATPRSAQFELSATIVRRFETERAGQAPSERVFLLLPVAFSHAMTRMLLLWLRSFYSESKRDVKDSLVI